MDTVVDSVQSENVFTTVKILGFDAGVQLAAMFATVAASGIAAAVRSLVP